jgi:uroporphyrin-III C-methyltransferase/precorrin-2 dehydrogenase/sirohydrochlorin ferrochelatase/uroporphyrin-III C-methyltransferase
MKIGKVILAGAGPGDPELISLKAVRFLQQADVILTDRLVSKQILDTWANKNAEIIPVGKQCRRGVSTPQQTINELMVHYALQGKLVVRIKGGDVSIFSNIMDELEVLVAENIPYEIVPGITAALGGAAYAGIPLTARGYSTAVRFLTCYTQNIITDHNWKELAETEDTLVFYMSSESLDMLVHNLVSNSIASDKLLAVIEQATTPFQKVHTCDLYQYETTLKNLPFISPSLVIIGRVVSLREKFAWIANSNSDEYYFKPLTSTVIPLAENKKNKNVSRA